MAVTPSEAAVKDASSSALVPIEGILGGSSLANPTPPASLRQVVAIGDGTDGSEQFQAVDSDGNAHVIVGRVSSGTVTNVAAATSATQILAARAARVGVVLNNLSQDNLYVGLSSSVAASGTAVLWKIPGGGQWTLPVAYTGALYGIWDGTDSGVNVCDF